MRCVLSAVLGSRARCAAAELRARASRCARLYRGSFYVNKRLLRRAAGGMDELHRVVDHVTNTVLCIAGEGPRDGCER